MRIVHSSPTEQIDEMAARVMIRWAVVAGGLGCSGYAPV
jgi:hypothetical protein